jgi:hypothetical protein
MGEVQETEGSVENTHTFLLSFLSAVPFLLTLVHPLENNPLYHRRKMTPLRSFHEKQIQNRYPL